MSKHFKGDVRKLARLTDGRTPMIAARKSKTTPLQKAIEKTMETEDQYSPTWFHKKRPVANAPCRWQPRRNKPTSMITSKRIPVTNPTIVGDLVTWILSGSQGASGASLP
jgi:hypothetical protein